MIYRIIAIPSRVVMLFTVNVMKISTSTELGKMNTKALMFLVLVAVLLVMTGTLGYGQGEYPC